MPVVAIQTTDDKRVRKWMVEVGERLRAPDYLSRPIQGRAKDLGKGVFVLDIDILWPRFLVNAMMCLILGAAAFTKIIGFSRTAMTGFLVGMLGLWGWNLLWSQQFYKVAVWVMVRRITGKWHKVSDASQVVLGMVARGKV